MEIWKHENYIFFIDGHATPIYPLLRARDQFPSVSLPFRQGDNPTEEYLANSFRTSRLLFCFVFRLVVFPSFVLLVRRPNLGRRFRWTNLFTNLWERIRRRFIIIIIVVIIWNNNIVCSFCFNYTTTLIL
jgi:hypothetical protein